MKYVITGSIGNIGKPLAEKLIAAGNDVTIISHSADKKAAIEALGAKAAIGSIEDVAFLTATFKGADAVYTMVPPKMDATDWKGYIKTIGKNYAAAIKAAGVKNVMHLSSVGGHMPDGAGPVSGHHYIENDLNALEGVNVKILRPGYFYHNLMANIGMIKNMGIMGGNYGENTTLVLVHPSDIADAAAEELLKLPFKGHSILYIASDERPVTEIATVLGRAIGKNDLHWVNFKDEDTFGAMTQMGLPNDVAKNYVEMGSAIRNGSFTSHYVMNKPSLSKTKLEDFAKEFAGAFSHS